MRPEHRTGCMLLVLLVLSWTGSAAQDSRDSVTLAIQRLNTASGPAARLQPFGGGGIWTLTRLFYAARAYRPAWIADGDRTRITMLLDRLGALGELGIEPADVPIAQIRSLAGAPQGPERSAVLDVAATMTWLRVGMLLSEGRVSPRAVDTLWAPASTHLDLVDRLRAALDSGWIATAFDSLAPPQNDAIRLKQALNRYQAIAAWDRIRADTFPYRLWQQSGPRNHAELAAALRRRARRS